MKMVLAVLWRAVVLYVAAMAGFLAGMFMPAVRVSRVVSHTAINVRTYDFDWLIAVMLVYLVLLGIGALRRRLREWAVTSSIALVLVVLVIALFTQIGIKDSAVSF